MWRQMAPRGQLGASRNCSSRSKLLFPLGWRVSNAPRSLRDPGDPSTARSERGDRSRCPSRRGCSGRSTHSPQGLTHRWCSQRPSEGRTHTGEDLRPPLDVRLERSCGRIAVLELARVMGSSGLIRARAGSSLRAGQDRGRVAVWAALGPRRRRLALRIARNADVAQLVERRLPKPKVAGSRPVVRFEGGVCSSRARVSCTSPRVVTSNSSGTSGSSCPSRALARSAMPSQAMTRPVRTSAPHEPPELAFAAVSTPPWHYSNTPWNRSSSSGLVNMRSSLAV